MRRNFILLILLTSLAACSLEVNGNQEISISTEDAGVDTQYQLEYQLPNQPRLIYYLRLKEEDNRSGGTSDSYSPPKGSRFPQ